MTPVPDDWAWHAATVEECGRCGRHFRGGPHGRQRCPACNPDDPLPLDELVQEPNAHLGPDWVWRESIGTMGCWAPLRDYWVLDADDARRLRALLHDWTTAGEKREYQAGFTAVIEAVFSRLAGGGPPDNTRARSAMPVRVIEVPPEPAPRSGSGSS